MGVTVLGLREFNVRRLSKFAVSLALLATLAGCGGKGDVDPVRIVQLSGRWRMVNRALDCEAHFVVFGDKGIHRLNDSGLEKTYFTVTKFIVGAGQVTIAGVFPDMKEPVSLVLATNGKSIQLTDLLDETGKSYKTPAADANAATKARMQNFLRIQQLRFEMEQCPA